MLVINGLFTWMITLQRTMAVWSLKTALNFQRKSKCRIVAEIFVGAIISFICLIIVTSIIFTIHFLITKDMNYNEFFLVYDIIFFFIELLVMIVFTTIIRFKLRHQLSTQTDWRDNYENLVVSVLWIFIILNAPIIVEVLIFWKPPNHTILFYLLNSSVNFVPYLAISPKMRRAVFVKCLSFLPRASSQCLM